MIRSSYRWCAYKGDLVSYVMIRTSRASRRQSLYAVHFLPCMLDVVCMADLRQVRCGATGRVSLSRMTWEGFRSRKKLPGRVHQLREMFQLTKEEAPRQSLLQEYWPQVLNATYCAKFAVDNLRIENALLWYLVPWESHWAHCINSLNVANYY